MAAGVAMPTGRLMLMLAGRAALIFRADHPVHGGQRCRARRRADPAARDLLVAARRGHSDALFPGPRYPDAQEDAGPVPGCARRVRARASRRPSDRGGARPADGRNARPDRQPVRHRRRRSDLWRRPARCADRDGRPLGPGRHADVRRQPGGAERNGRQPCRDPGEFEPGDPRARIDDAEGARLVERGADDRVRC